MRLPLSKPAARPKMALWPIILPILCLLVSGLLSCVHAMAGFTPSLGIRGMVYDQGGNPLSGVEVRLADRLSLSDHSGRLRFEGLRPGRWGLSATGPNIEPYATQVEIGSPSEVIYLSLFSRDDLAERALSLLGQGDFPMAVSCGRRAIALDGEDPYLRFLLALCLGASGAPEELSEAREICRRLSLAGIRYPALLEYAKRLGP